MAFDHVLLTVHIPLQTDVIFTSPLCLCQPRFLSLLVLVYRLLKRAFSRFDWTSDPEAHFATGFSRHETFYDLMVLLAAGADPRVIPQRQQQPVCRNVANVFVVAKLL